MTKEFLWSSSRISIRTLVASLSIQQFRWLSNSSRIRWPLSSCEILPGFDQDFCDQKIWWPFNSCKILKGFWSELFSRIRWPQNSHEILQGFRSEFWLSAIISNNSDDYEILKNKMTMEFLLNSSMIWSEFFKTSLKISRTENYINLEFLWNSAWIWPRKSFGIL